MMSATGVNKIIDTDETWAWAKESLDHLRLQDCIAKVHADATPFCNYVTTHDVKEVRKQYKTK